MTVNPRQSFKLKLCLWIFSVSLFTFLLIFSAGIWFSYQEVRTGVSNTVNSKLNYAVRALDEGLTCTEVASDNLQSIIRSRLVRTDNEGIYTLCKEFLKANPRNQGIAIGYEEGVIPGHEKGFSPYVMNGPDGFIVRDLATTKDYRNDNWYCVAAQTGKAAWSEPFRESNGTVITSYNVPLRDSEGRLIGVTAVDLNLSVVSDSLQSLSPYAGASLCIVDEKGRYVAHADRSMILNHSAPQYIMDFLASGEGYYEDKSGSEPYYVFSEKEEKTGWNILLYVPRRAMAARTGKMLNAMIIDMTIGIILLLLVCVGVISRLTKPLEKFSEAAREISHGHFDIDLPVIKDHNELYDLRQALCSMEVSLDDYVKRLEETSNKKASIERELDIARKIQMAMIPKIFPPYPDRDSVDIYASLTPALAVGGDLYDFNLVGDTLFFCIGDVSGKGVPASLLMAITRSLFRNNAIEGTTPGKIATVLNNALSENNEMSMFVTMFIASYNLKTGELRICNCGHNKPATNGVILDPATMTAEPQETFSLMKSAPANLAVGVMQDFPYKEVTIYVKPGDMILLYTDGITEAENKKKELYGEQRMLDLLDKVGKDASSETIIKSLVADVKKHAGLAPQSDDITALCLRCCRLEQ